MGNHQSNERCPHRSSSSRVIAPGPRRTETLLTYVARSSLLGPQNPNRFYNLLFITTLEYSKP